VWRSPSRQRTTGGASCNTLPKSRRQARAPRDSASTNSPSGSLTAYSPMELVLSPNRIARPEAVGPCSGGKPAGVHLRAGSTKACARSSWAISYLLAKPRAAPPTKRRRPACFRAPAAHHGAVGLLQRCHAGTCGGTDERRLCLWHEPRHLGERPRERQRPPKHE
jgi:hypothetical protein